MVLKVEQVASGGSNLALFATKISPCQALNAAK